MKKATILITLITLFFLGGQILAQTVELPKAGLTPNSPFYFLDTLGEKIGLFFTFSAEKKVEKAMKYAEEKLAEAKAMAEKDKIKPLEKATQKYQDYLNLANKKIKTGKIQEKEAGELDDLITDKAIKHQKVLTSLMNKETSEETKKELEKTMGISETSFQETKKEIGQFTQFKKYDTKEACEKECQGDKECESLVISVHEGTADTVYYCRKTCRALGHFDSSEECLPSRKHYQKCEIGYVPTRGPELRFCYQAVDKCPKDQWVSAFTSECKEACASLPKSCVRKSMDCYGCESPGDVEDKCDPPCTIDEICQGYDPDSRWSIQIPPYSKYECRKWKCPEGSFRGIDPSCPSDSPCAVNEECLPSRWSYISYSSYYGYCWQCKAVCKPGSYTLDDKGKCDKDCGQPCQSDKDAVIKDISQWWPVLCYTCPVVEGEKPCDGTPHGQCGILKPRYCENGQFIDKCSLCGCPTYGKYKCDEKTGKCLAITPVCGDGNKEFPPEECDPPGIIDCRSSKKIYICDETCKWGTGRCDRTTCKAMCEAGETECFGVKTAYCDEANCYWGSELSCLKGECGAGCANDADCPEGKACDLTICGCKDIPTTAVTPICTETSEWLEGHTLQMNYLTVKVDSQTYKFAQFACADEYDYYKVAWCGKVKSISKEKIADENYVISLFYEKSEPCPPCDPGMVSAGCQKIRGESGVEHGSCFCVSADQ